MTYLKKDFYGAPSLILRIAQYLMGILILDKKEQV